MARERGGGRSVTKKGLGDRGHEIFTSHTYAAPNTLSSGLPTRREEPGAGTCPAGHGKKHASGTQRPRPRPQAHGTQVGVQVANHAGVAKWPPAPASSSRQRSATRMGQPRAGVRAGRPAGELAQPGARSLCATRPRVPGCPAPPCPFPFFFLSPHRSLNLNEGLTDGRAASASRQAPGKCRPGEGMGC